MLQSVAALVRENGIMKSKILKSMALFFGVAMCLTACGGNADNGVTQESAASVQAAYGREADNGVTQEPTVLVLASFEDSPYLQRRVELYNQTHADYQIEIKRYERSENMEEDGVLLIQRKKLLYILVHSLILLLAEQIPV